MNTPINITHPLHLHTHRTNSQPLRVLFCAREPSADQHAAGVLHAMRALSQRPIDAFGLGGPRLIQAGLRSSSPPHEPVMGFTDVLRHIPALIKLLQHTAYQARQIRPDLAVLVDAPDFNLPLGHRLKRAHIPVISLCAPQAWAWRSGRAKTLRHDLDTLLTLFPFERAFFAKHGTHTVHIGHPHAWDALHTPHTPRDTLLLMPGSRRQEITRNAPPMLQSARALLHLTQAKYLTIALAPGWTPNAFHEALPSNTTLPPNITFLPPSNALFARSILALCTSGTACLQTALASTPTIVLYTTDALTWNLARTLVRTPWIAMPNILLQRTLCPELLQKRATPQAILHAATYLLTHIPHIERTLSTLTDILLLDTHTHPYTHAARHILHKMNAPTHDLF